MRAVLKEDAKETRRGLAGLSEEASEMMTGRTIRGGCRAQPYLCKLPGDTRSNTCSWFPQSYFFCGGTEADSGKNQHLHGSEKSVLQRQPYSRAVNRPEKPL